MTEPLLRVDAIDVWYGDVQVLHGLSLEVREGEIVTVVAVFATMRVMYRLSCPGTPVPSTRPVAPTSLSGVQTNRKRGWPARAAVRRLPFATGPGCSARIARSWCMTGVASSPLSTSVRSSRHLCSKGRSSTRSEPR